MALEVNEPSRVIMIPSDALDDGVELDMIVQFEMPRILTIILGPLLGRNMEWRLWITVSSCYPCPNHRGMSHRLGKESPTWATVFLVRISYPIS